MPQFTDMRRPALWDDYELSAYRAAANGGQTHVRTVVVGYDGSEGARRALIPAAEAAGTGGHVVVVIAVPPAESLAQEQRGSRFGDPERLLEQASVLLRGHNVEITTRVEDAEPAEALVAAACDTDAALIVVGARGDSYVTRALRGSVGEKLVGRAPCDVLIAR